MAWYVTMSAVSSQRGNTVSTESMSGNTRRVRWSEYFFHAMEPPQMAGPNSLASRHALGFSKVVPSSIYNPNRSSVAGHVCHVCHICHVCHVCHVCQGCHPATRVLPSLCRPPLTGRSMQGSRKPCRPPA